MEKIKELEDMKKCDGCHELTEETKLEYFKGEWLCAECKYYKDDCNSDDHKYYGVSTKDFL